MMTLNTSSASSYFNPPNLMPSLSSTTHNVGNWDSSGSNKNKEKIGTGEKK